jgi:ectoine hydroxylase-related dioxygenase (phytanoyl-CoA dioxygenase family)
MDSMVKNNVHEMLDQPFKVTDEQIKFFQKNGFIKIKNVLPAEAVHYMNEKISAEVKRLNTQHLPIEQRDTYGKAFLQIFNLWTKSTVIKEIVFSKRLAKIAADLMSVDGVRMYHDQALFKEPSGGHTPWHADQYYWPLSTDKTVTVWIPLQRTDLELGPLEFSAGSHQLTEGRNLKISDDSEREIQKRLTLRDFEQVVEPFDLGEVSFHSGWVFHRAGPNKTDTMRKVMTVIYMDKDMRLKEPANENQVNDWNTWCPGAQIGEVIDTPLNPVLYSR